MAFFQLFLALILGGLFLQSDIALAADSRIPCRLRNSNYCKDPKYFKRDEKDGCASIKTKCRKKFCQYNCFGEVAPPKNSKIHGLCKKHCDPYPHKIINIDPEEGMPLSDQEKELFAQRFEDKHLKWSREMEEAIQSTLTRMNNALPWCEGECYKDSGSCETKHTRPLELWRACAQKCYFIKDIKEHAEKCAAQKPIPKPRNRAERKG